MHGNTSTSNGFEINNPTDKITSEELKLQLGSEFGLDAETPEGRVKQIKSLSPEGIAILIEYINRAVQGSRDSLISHDKVIKIGGKKTIALEDRYNVFYGLVEEIKKSPDDINPERLGDTLALGIVLLHPFHDGNGRTARVIGLIFRNNYDQESYATDFNTVTEPRDEAKKRGGFVINGYVPSSILLEDRTDPKQVLDYIHRLLTQESEGAYTSCFGQAELHKT